MIASKKEAVMVWKESDRVSLRSEFVRLASAEGANRRVPLTKLLVSSFELGATGFTSADVLFIHRIRSWVVMGRENVKLAACL